MLCWFNNLLFFSGRNTAKYSFHHGDVHYQENFCYGRAKQFDFSYGTAHGKYFGEYRSRLWIDIATWLICRDIAGGFLRCRSGNTSIRNIDRDVLDYTDVAENAPATSDPRQQHHSIDSSTNVQHRPGSNCNKDSATNGDLPVHPEQNTERVQFEAWRSRQRTASRTWLQRWWSWRRRYA